MVSPRLPALGSIWAVEGAVELGTGGAALLRLGKGQALPLTMKMVPQKGWGKVCAVTYARMGWRLERASRPQSSCRSHNIPPA